MWLPSQFIKSWFASCFTVLKSGEKSSPSSTPFCAFLSLASSSPSLDLSPRQSRDAFFHTEMNRHSQQWPIASVKLIFQLACIFLKCALQSATFHQSTLHNQDRSITAWRFNKYCHYIIKCTLKSEIFDNWIWKCHKEATLQIFFLSSF